MVKIFALIMAVGLKEKDNKMKTQKEIEDKLNELQKRIDTDYSLYLGVIPTIAILKWILDK